MPSVIFAGDYATKYANTFIDLFFMHFLTAMSRLLNLPWLVMPPWPFLFDIWPLNLKSIPTFLVIKSFCKVLFHIARWLQIGIIITQNQTSNIWLDKLEHDMCTQGSMMEQMDYYPKYISNVSWKLIDGKRLKKMWRTDRHVKCLNSCLLQLQIDDILLLLRYNHM